jgi:hypothetical protein
MRGRFKDEKKVVKAGRARTSSDSRVVERGTPRLPDTSQMQAALKVRLLGRWV